MTCDCDCQCEHLRDELQARADEIKSLKIQIESLIRIDDHRRSAEHAYARRMVELRGLIGGGGE